MTRNGDTALPGAVAAIVLAVVVVAAVAIPVAALDFTGYESTGDQYDTGDQSTAGMGVKPDGTRMYSVDTGDVIEQYDLSTAWDVSSASSSGSFDLSAQDSRPHGMALGPNGDNLYISGSGSDNVYWYTLSTSYDVTTATYQSSVSVPVEDSLAKIYAVDISDDGNTLIVGSSWGDKIFQYDVSTSFNLSTAAHTGNFSVNSGTDYSDPYGLRYAENGTELFMASDSGYGLVKYDLSTAYDVTTGSVVANTTFDKTSPRGAGLRPSGDNFYAIFNDGVIQEYGAASTPTPTPTSSSDTYTHTFILDDNTGKFPDPDFEIEQYNGEDIKTIDGSTGTAITETDWYTVDETTFNHDEEAYVEMEETARHRLTLTDGDSTYQEIGFVPKDSANPYTITVGVSGPGTPTPTATSVNVTGTPTPIPGGSDDPCVFAQNDGGDYTLLCEFSDGVTDYEYDFTTPDGTYYEGDLDFDEPTDYYEGEFDSNFTENLTDGEGSDPEDFTINWTGEYENGTSFNGSTNFSDGFLFGSGDGGGGVGPVVGEDAGAGAPTWLVILPGLLLVAYAAYRRYKQDGGSAGVNLGR